VRQTALQQGWPFPVATRLPVQGFAKRAHCGPEMRRRTMVETIRDYEALAEVFRALAHPVRLQILMRTIDDELCVQDLQDDLDRSQPNISQHLTVLRERALVIAERKGKRVCYRPADDWIAQVIRLAASALERLEAA
jgi:DNA-binding transcriptional ArsR family regulator